MIEPRKIKQFLGTTALVAQTAVYFHDPGFYFVFLAIYYLTQHILPVKPKGQASSIIFVRDFGKNKSVLKRFDRLRCGSVDISQSTMPSGNVRAQRGPQGQRNNKRRVFISSSDSSEGDGAASQPKRARDEEFDLSFKKPLPRPDQKASPKSTQKSLPQSTEKPSPRPIQKSSLLPSPKPISQLKNKFLPGKSSPLSVQKPSPSQTFLSGKPHPQPEYKPSSSLKPSSSRILVPSRSYQKPSTPRQDQKPSTQLSQKHTPESDQKSSPRPKKRVSFEVHQELSPRPKKKVSFEVHQEPSSLFAPRLTPWALSAPSQELRPLPSLQLRPLPSQKPIPLSDRKSDNAHSGEDEDEPNPAPQTSALPPKRNAREIDNARNRGDKDELNSTPQTPSPPPNRDASKIITENEAEEPQKADSDVQHPFAEESSSSEELFAFYKGKHETDHLGANAEENSQSEKDSGYSENGLSDFIVDDDDLIVPVRRSKRIKAARTGRNKNNRSTAKRDTTARSRERPEKGWGAAIEQLDEKLDTLDKRIGHLQDLMAKDQKAPDDERETTRENLDLKTRKLDLEKKRIDLEEQRLGLEKANSTRLHQVIQDLMSLVNSLQSRRSTIPPDNTQHKENGTSAKHAHANDVLGQCDNAERDEETGGQLVTETIM